MYVVAGVTGRTGSAVAEALLAAGHPVRAIVRVPDRAAPWRGRGAEVAVVSLDDAAGMTEALRGAAGAYLLVPPNYGAADYLEDRARLARALARAVRASAVDHVVLLSAMGGHRPAGTGLIRATHAGEQAIGSAARNLTILRAAFFVENWGAGLGPARTEGVLPSFLTPDRRIPMVSARDVGRVAAEALLAPARGRRIIELAGPADASPDDVAVALGGLLGRPVRVAAAPPEAAIAALTALGASSDTARLFQEMFAGLNAGVVAFEGKGTTLRRGATPLVDTLRMMLRQGDGAP